MEPIFRRKYSFRHNSCENDSTVLLVERKRKIMAFQIIILFFIASLLFTHAFVPLITQKFLRRQGRLEMANLFDFSQLLAELTPYEKEGTSSTHEYASYYYL